MKFYSRVFILMAALAVFTAGSALALDVIAEQRFSPAKRKPERETLNFSTTGYSVVILKVQRGPAQDPRCRDHRRSRERCDQHRHPATATIALNGRRILGPVDFPRRADTVERVITPTAGVNTLKVSVRGDEDGWVLVQVLGEPRFALPPDPGAAGEATLAGIDANGNGIRDDVERWIYQTYPDSEKLRQALIQEYYPLQNMIINGDAQDRDAVYDDMNELGRAGECLHYVHPDKPHTISAALKAEIINSGARTEAYFQSSRMLGGGTFSIRHPNEWKESCRFDPDSLEN